MQYNVPKNPTHAYGCKADSDQIPLRSSIGSSNLNSLEKTAPRINKMRTKITEPDDQRIPMFFKYVQEKCSNIVIDCDKHGRILKQRLTYLDEKEKNKDRVFSDIKRLFDNYLGMSTWPVNQNGHNLSDFFSDRIFSKLLQARTRNSTRKSESAEKRKELVKTLYAN